MDLPITVMREYLPGDLVWAKMKGFPPWPGKVMEHDNVINNASSVRQKFWIFFFGTKNFAWIGSSAIWPYWSYRQLFTAKRRLPAYLKTALEQIQIVFEDLAEEDKARQTKMTCTAASKQTAIGTANQESAWEGEEPNKRKNARRTAGRSPDASFDSESPVLAMQPEKCQPELGVCKATGDTPVIVEVVSDALSSPSATQSSQLLPPERGSAPLPPKRSRLRITSSVAPHERKSELRVIPSRRLSTANSGTKKTRVLKERLSINAATEKPIDKRSNSSSPEKRTRAKTNGVLASLNVPRAKEGGATASEIVPRYDPVSQNVSRAKKRGAPASLNVPRAKRSGTPASLVPRGDPASRNVPRTKKSGTTASRNVPRAKKRGTSVLSEARDGVSTAPILTLEFSGDSPEELPGSKCRTKAIHLRNIDNISGTTSVPQVSGANAASEASRAMLNGTESANTIGVASKCLRIGLMCANDQLSSPAWANVATALLHAPNTAVILLHGCCPDGFESYIQHWKRVGTPRDLARHASIILCLFSDQTEELRQAVMDPEFGRFCSESQRRKSSLIVLSSLNQPFASRLKYELNKRDWRLLECPLLPSGQGSFGSFTLLASGPRPVFKELQKLLCSDPESRFHAFYLGQEMGRASQLGSVLQGLAAVCTAALAETVALCNRLGISEEILLRAAEISSLGSAQIPPAPEAMNGRLAQPDVPLDQRHLHLKNLLDIGEKMCQPLSVSAAANELYKTAKLNSSHRTSSDVSFANRRS